MPDQWYLAHTTSYDDFKRALQDNRLSWCYAERMEDTLIAKLSELLNGKIAIERWQHGRAFGPQMEIAWWRTDDGLDLRLWVENGGPPVGLEWNPDPIMAMSQFKDIDDILLFGEYDSEKASQSSQPAWSEARIPRYLHYPVEDQTARVKLVIAKYTLEGMLREQRFVKLAGVESDDIR